MSILGINNRTENWKTAYEFAPFFRDGNACAKLARTLDEGDSPTGNEVKIELFWKGMRDYADKEFGSEKDEARKAKQQELKDKCTEAYCAKGMFSGLSDDIKKFSQKPRNQDARGGLREPKTQNYVACNPDGLWDNLYNTEIDIVLETPGRLLIGEAKEEAGLGASGDYVLVHQLIRQFVMAKILLHLAGKETKKVVPFLVVPNADEAKKTGQVRFMISQQWLKEKNVLTWGDIRRLQP